MRRFFVLLLGLGAIGILPALGGAITPNVGASTGTGSGAPPSVHGFVLDALTGLPVAGASVAASSGPSTTTTAMGDFVLQLKNGTATLAVSAAGYHPATVTVVVGPSAAPVNVSLQPFVFAVHGAVVDHGSSAALSGAVIVANPGDIVATSNAGGMYRLMLENGSYILTISAPGYQTSTVPLAVDGVPVTLYLFLSPPTTALQGAAFSAVTVVTTGSIVGAVCAAAGGWTARRRPVRRPPVPSGPLAGLPSFAGPWVRARSSAWRRDRLPPP